VVRGPLLTGREEFVVPVSAVGWHAMSASEGRGKSRGPHAHHFVLGVPPEPSLALLSKATGNGQTHFVAAVVFSAFSAGFAIGFFADSPSGRASLIAIFVATA
jgi:hypothetical protein